MITESGGSGALGSGRGDRVVTYNELVGRRLRAIRRQRGLSLQDVQRMTEGEFKAAVLGAYERGERALSLPRFHRLSEIYGVPITQMLPPEEGAGAASEAETAERPLVIDLGKVERLRGEEADLLERFLRGIQVERQDFNGRVMTIRRDDLRILSMLLDISPASLGERLEASTTGDPSFEEG